MKIKNSPMHKFTGEFGTIYAIRDNGRCWFSSKIGGMTKYIPDKRGRSVAIQMISDVELSRIIAKTRHPLAPAFERWLRAEVIPEL